MKKIIIELTDDQVKKAKDNYDKIKTFEPQFSLSFDEFLQKIITNVYDNFLQFSNQFSAINDSVWKMMKDNMENSEKMEETLKDIDKLMQEMFKSSSEKSDKTNEKKQDEVDKNKKMKN